MEKNRECSILFPSSGCLSSLRQKLKFNNVPFPSFLQTNYVHSLNGKLPIVFVRIKGRRDWPGPLPEADFHPTSKFSRLHFPLVSHPLIPLSLVPHLLRPHPFPTAVNHPHHSFSSLPFTFGPLCAHPLKLTFARKNTKGELHQQFY